MPEKTDCLSQPLQLVTCTACDMQFQPVVPTSDELCRWYDYMGQLPQAFTLTPLLRRRLERMLRPLEAFRLTGRILEVGCGGGLFLKVAESRGWAAHATEVSATCCQKLRPWLGPCLHEGEIFSAPFAQGSFDVAVLIEVVEHLANPFDYLRHIFRFMRPGGTLFMTTPNRAGISARLLGGRWRCITAEHLNYFTPQAMTRMLTRIGFEQISHKTSYVDVKNIICGEGSKSPMASASMPAADPSTWSAQVKALAKDLCIEAANVAVAASRRGDTLRTWAQKPWA